MNKVLEKIITESPHLSWMKDNTVFLTLHGSRAYGTYIEESSDYDYKGVCIPTAPYFYGYQNNFDQAVLKEPDTVIYNIKKFFNLSASANPNLIETLYTEPSDHVIVDSIGEILLDNKDKFLSKRVKYTFLGYAASKIKKIKTHKKWLLNPIKNYPTRKDMGLPEQTLIPQDQMMAAEAEIKKELDRFNFDFMEELSEPMKIAVFGTISEMLAELKIFSDEHWLGAARKIGMDDNFIEIMQKERAYKNKKIEFDQYQNWKKTRNPARAALEAKYKYDTKNAYHLVRLTRMAKEMLTTGKVLVKRPDREELIAIRNGLWTYDQLMEYSDNMEKEINKIYEESNILPKTPDINYLNNLCISLIEKSLSKYSWHNISKSLKNMIANSNLDRLVGNE